MNIKDIVSIVCSDDKEFNYSNIEHVVSESTIDDGHTILAITSRISFATISNYYGKKEIRIRRIIDKSVVDSSYNCIDDIIRLTKAQNTADLIAVRNTYA